ncbi:hypothetical protein FRC06_007491, partial [Ceratobasidium sp. 370]
MSILVGHPFFHITQSITASSDPTEREKEMRAQAKAAQRMLDLEAEPKPVSRQGLRTPGHIKKKTAKLLAAVRVGYDKLVRAMAGSAPLEPSSSHSRGNLEDDLVPNNEEELAAKAAEAVGKDLRRRNCKRKPTSCNVHGYERQILTTAKLHLFALSLVEGPYQTRTWFLKMAKVIFAETWHQELPKVPIHDPSEEILQV